MTGNSEAMGPGRRPAGPEVGFGEIAIVLLQARFWIASELATKPGATQ
jgi:hypothetical protein